MKRFGAITAAVLVLGAFGAANASGDPTFTASSTGELAGKALENQVLYVGGEVLCTSASASGAISATESFAQDVEVAYSGCKAFGLVNVHVPKAKYRLTADGLVHILEPIAITVTKTLFTAHCTVTIPAQTVGTVDYVSKGSKLEVVPTVEGIEYTATGTPCGTGTKTDGTFSGASEVERVGGGWVAFDP